MEEVRRHLFKRRRVSIDLSATQPSTTMIIQKKRQVKASRQLTHLILSFSLKTNLRIRKRWIRKDREVYQSRTRRITQTWRISEIPDSLSNRWKMSHLRTTTSWWLTFRKSSSSPQATQSLSKSQKSSRTLLQLKRFLGSLKSYTLSSEKTPSRLRISCTRFQPSTLLRSKMCHPSSRQEH